MKLRDYQSTALTRLRSSYQTGHRAPCLVLPTGGGKTLMAAAVATGAVERGTKILFVADRETLIDQTVDKFRVAGLENMRVIQSDRDDGSPDAPVTIAMAQTLRMPRWEGKLPDFDLIMWDECHGVVAATYDRTLKRWPSARLLGLTATPTRGDNKPLEVFDDLVIGATVKELTDLGYLAPCHVLRPPDGVLGPTDLALDPVDAYLKHAENRRAGVFCNTKKQAATYQEAFLAAGIPCGLVTSDTPNRADELVKFANDEYRVLVSVDCLTQGWDDPGCAVAIIARKPKHVGLWLQICGRVMRPHPNKSEALIIDLCGAFWDHGPPDLDREYRLDGKAISTVVKDRLSQCRACGSCFLAGPRVCPYCGAEIEIRERALPRNRNVGVSADGTPNPARAWVVRMQSKHEGTCRKCARWFPRGTPVLWVKGKGAMHQKCPQSQIYQELPP